MEVKEKGELQKYVLSYFKINQANVNFCIPILLMLYIFNIYVPILADA